MALNSDAYALIRPDLQPGCPVAATLAAPARKCLHGCGSWFPSSPAPPSWLRVTAGPRSRAAVSTAAHTRPRQDDTARPGLLQRVPEATRAQLVTVACVTDWDEFRATLQTSWVSALRQDPQ